MRHRNQRAARWNRAIGRFLAPISVAKTARAQEIRRSV